MSTRAAVLGVGVLCLVVAGCGAPGEALPGPGGDLASARLGARVHHDGLYLDTTRGTEMAWLRFYEDGTVLSVTTGVLPAGEVWRWLKRERGDMPAGRFRLRGDELRLVVGSRAGSVTGRGRVSGERLALVTESSISDRRVEWDYYFVPLEEEPVPDESSAVSR